MEKKSFLKLCRGNTALGNGCSRVPQLIWINTREIPGENKLMLMLRNFLFYFALYYVCIKAFLPWGFMAKFWKSSREILIIICKYTMMHLENMVLVCCTKSIIVFYAFVHFIVVVLRTQPRDHVNWKKVLLRKYP